MPNNLGMTHQFVSAKADGVDATLVRASNWNAAHGLAGTAANDGMKLVANSLNSPQNAELLLPDVTQLVNKTGLAHAAGDVVAVGTAATDKSVQLDDTQGSFRTFVVALQANADGIAGIYARAGVIVGVLAQGVIARWQYVRKSATTKAIEDAGVTYSSTAIAPPGALGVALNAAAGGVVTVLWFGSSTPNLPAVSGNAGKFLQTDGTGLAFANAVAAAGTLVGSGNGTNYSTTSASFVDVDATNLKVTVTIPTNAKFLIVVATFALAASTIIDGAAHVQLLAAGSVVGTCGYINNNALLPAGVITTYGVVANPPSGSQTIALQFKGDGALACTINNQALEASASQVRARMLYVVTF